ncbi:hypothetical protein RHGRI_027003 [Rhododendron griersonianum]|uniref:Uncharacterized protein n=1 Tax=Rhododendron griersonianum TaxID=479676 RepID=A0AAV6IY96_9ERIC|nr:hypothetical protein RHGRI_027003 [Rhododendron griersonianum]
MHIANDLTPLHFSLGLASTGFSSREVVPYSESSTESDSLDSQTASLLLYFRRDYRTGGMSNPNVLDPNDESWLEMPLDVLPLRAVSPDAEIVKIEDDSPSEASGLQRENEEAEETRAEEEEEEEEEELVEDDAEEQAGEGGEDVDEGETVDTSKINRALFKRCKNQPSLEEAILFFPEKERDAPSILKYTPTYQGFIRQKDTKTAETEKPTQQEEKLEEVFEDSFGEIPDILLPSIRRPL